MAPKLFSRSALVTDSYRPKLTTPKSTAPTVKTKSKKTTLVPISDSTINAHPTSEKGSAKRLHPSILQKRIRFLVLEKLDECRILRAIDVAAYVFADRPLSAAITAAQRALRGLHKDKLIKQFTSNKRQVFYALTKQGADWLNELLLQNNPNLAEDAKAKSSTRWASGLTSPEHHLYGNFIKLCCLSRGLDACDESGISTHTSSLNSFSESHHVSGLMEIYSVKGGLKQVRPDVLSYDDRGAVWFEIDKSARGEGRRSDLTRLFRQIGHPLSRKMNWLRDKEPQILSHVVIFTSSKGIFNTAARLLRASFPEDVYYRTEGSSIQRKSECVIRGDSALVFELWEKWVDISDTENPLKEAFVGYASIQMLPPWLIGTSSKSLKNSSEWFPSNYLPYAKASKWRKPISLTQSKQVPWKNYGLS